VKNLDTSEENPLQVILADLWNTAIKTDKGSEWAIKALDKAYDKIISLYKEVEVSEAKTIRALFDMSEFDPGGTMFDPHMMSRSPEYIAESRQYNSDHAWACMSAQGKIDKHIAKLKGKE